MATGQQRARGGTLALIGMVGMVTTALICCKIAGLIDWPIAWVLSPLWGAFLFALFVVFCCAIVSGISEAVKGR
jgi:hypothetical protein